MYEQMGALGWAPREVDVMEVWQVARFMGISGDGATGDPIIRGSRGLSTPSDRQKSGPSQGGSFVDSTIAERARAGAAGSRAVILRPPTPQEP